MKKLTLVAVTVVAALAASLLILWGGLTRSQSFAQEKAEETARLASEVKVSWEELNAQVQSLLQRTKELAQVVTSAPDKRAILPDVSKELGDLADSFERIAQKRDETEKVLLERVERLRKLPSDVDAKIAELQQQKSKLLGRIETLKATPSPESEIRIKATTSIISDLDAQIRVWSSFRDVQIKIGDRAKITVDQIRKLMVAIEENAAVYRSKKNTVDATGDVLAAISLMEGAPEFEELTQSIVASWGDMDKLIQELADWAAQILLSK